MTNEQIRQLTDTIYRALFNADGAALRIRLGLPPADPDDKTDDDLREAMGDLAIETLGRIEDETADWLERSGGVSWSRCRAQTKIVALKHASLAQKQARWDGIDLLTGMADGSDKKG